MRVRAWVFLTASAGLLALPGGADAAMPKACQAEGRECMLLAVPLDRSGAVPGAVRLRIERRRAEHARRAPLFVFSGPPGWSSRPDTVDAVRYLLRREARTRDIVAMDLRGTGRSGALSCPALERLRFRQPTAAAAECARLLGPRRGFYTARDSADDVEAVRRALGIEQIALLGSSYGAQVAFAYAQRYPSRVDRLVLDSIPGPEGFDALYRRGFAAMPQTVQVLCRKERCHRASGDPGREVIDLARRLERGPLSAKLNEGFGRVREVSIGAFDLFEALQRAVAGDRAIMGHIHNAWRGDPKPLLRLLRPPPGKVFLPRDRLSMAAYAASMCEESMLPWSRDTPTAQRPRQAAAFVGALPAGSLLPFGPRAALGSDVLELCRRWPMASVAPEPPRLLTSTPTLIVTGVDDVLAPVSAARAVANLIPGARLLRLRGAGHGTFESYGGGSSCATQILHEFLAGAMPTDVCGPEWKSYRGASAPPPLSLAEVIPDRRVSGRAGRTLTAVNATIRDGGPLAQARLMANLMDWYSHPRRKTSGIPATTGSAGGLRHGTYTLSLSSGRLVLHGVSYVPGVRLSGSVVFAEKPAGRRGTIRVSGRGAARGTLSVRRGVMTGRLGGRVVSAPTRWGPDVGFTLP